MKSLAEKLRPVGMIRFHSSRLFLPEDKLMFGNWLARDMEVSKRVMLFGKRMVKSLPRNMETVF